jgi:tetratricopeptide (TPR) repeat protein
MNRLTAVLLMCCVVSGCERPRTLVPKERQATTMGSSQSEREHLTAALDYLQRADEFEESQSGFQVAYHLNRWLDLQKEPSTWQPDPLTAKLPRDVRNSREVSDLGRLRFTIEDARAVQEAVWLSQIAHWISPRTADAELEAWISQHVTGGDSLEAEQLTVAHRLFDWTVRNIQLDELLPYPADVAAQPTPQPGQVVQTVVPPPQRGIPGPGYQFFPWQTLLYGRGDSWQRARVFVLLCRQQGIDAFMLAFPGKTTTPRPRPWLAAVLVGERLYLFDPRLGLPIFGAGGHGIATLEQVLADPQLLAALTLDDTHRYELDPADLKEILVLLDASPTALSRRMKAVEQQLTGKYRVALTVSASATAAKTQRCRGISDVALWSVPFETEWYQQAQADRREKDDRAAMEHELEFGIFSLRVALVQARYLHFRGELESQGEKPGAKALYLQSRLPQEQLNAFTSSEEIQKQLGFTRDKDVRDVIWQARLKSSQHMMQQAKRHATYWLGLAQYDSGKFDAAVEWFERRTLEGSPGSPWLSGARYNLGRTYEALHDFEKACRWYEASEPSPQEHGNRLRARWLRQRQPRPAGN